jgi:galactokinase
MEAKNRAITAFKERFGNLPAGLAFAPGRVNLLGEHVDYNDGFVLPVALDRATWVAFSPSSSDSTDLWAADFEESASLAPDQTSAGPSAWQASAPPWAKYPAGVAWSLARAGQDVRGINAAFASDVPRGAGLSSSASVEVAFAQAWGAAAGWSLPPMELAILCQRAENDFVGVQCGIMDQFASSCGEAGRVLLLDCRSLEWQGLPLPTDASIVIADTSVRRSLADSAYNERRESCRQAVELLSREMPGIKALRDVSPEDFALHAASLPPVTARRAQHIVDEIARARRAVDLLSAGDITGFGALMNACHASLRDLYEVSCPELDVMVAIAQSLDGCLGARLTGAGFGGCTVNLVLDEKAAEFSRALAYRYQGETGKTAQVYLTSAGPGAGVE